MDEVLLRKLTRQLKFLNFFLAFFGLLFVAGFIVIGFLLYKAVNDVDKAENNVTSLQQKADSDLNVQQQLCNSTGSLSSLLKSESDVCQ